MIKPILKPNLPETYVKHCLIGEKYIEEINELNGLNINCLPLKSNKNLNKEIESHADILAFNAGKGIIVINPGSIGEGVLENLGYSVIGETNIKSPYPSDILLNAALIGENLICKKDYISSNIINILKDRNTNIIDTNQGYARCNICIVSDKAVITEDDGIAYLLKFYQYDVLKIHAGDIYLSEKHYGFLGGASGKISKDRIYFSGDITTHSDYDNIIRFLNKYNIQPIYNKNRQLRDFGGFIALTECF